ncbi:MAG: helix-turn-helix transcriptional regulator [Bacteroidia bacterium]|nr:helix-turn-helix transcriptional regulator [Bacteroidia bacterium]
MHLLILPKQKTKDILTSAIKRYEFKKGLPHEFEILDLRKLYNDFSASLTAPHRAGFYHLIWFKKGKPDHQVDFTSVQLKSNSLLFVNKDCVHRFDDSNIFDGKVILFTEEFFCKTKSDRNYLRSSILFNDLLSISSIHIPTANHLIVNIILEMEAEQQMSKDPFQSDILLNNLRNLLLLSERERRKQDFTELKKDANLEYVIKFRDLLEAQFVTTKRVGQFAALINITEKRLNQATKAVLGKTPKRLIDDRLMLESKRLLAHSAGSIKEIGFQLGFEEPTNFIKYFRNHQGSTPLEFRESFKR